MDLLTAVAASMLPVSRLKAATAFNHLRATGNVCLEEVLELAGPPSDRVPCGEALASATAAAGAALQAAESSGIEPIPSFDPRYPPLLACIQDPPPVLWVRGSVDALERRCVAIVGSRAATDYALQVGRRLAAELAERDIVVVSGLARGVDAAAHLGALDRDGVTIAVLGSGLDRVYPAAHASLAHDLVRKGLLISELGPGAAPRPEHFPLRNRIISGISLGVVVVEANEKSGSLITAGCALRQGRDVMAVPGNVLSGRNRGSHSLLKDGAKIVESADDILEDLGWTPASRPGDGDRRNRGRLAGDPLLGKMDPGEPYALDELVRKTGVAAAKLLPRLMELELLGHVTASGGGRFTKVC